MVIYLKKHAHVNHNLKNIPILRKIFPLKTSFKTYLKKNTKDKIPIFQIQQKTNKTFLTLLFFNPSLTLME